MFTFLFNTLTRSILVLLVAMVSVNYMPDSLFKDFPLDPKQVEPLDYDSVMPKEWNTKLSDGQPEFIQLNNILGPESIAISTSSGLIYSGLADGRLVEMDPSKNYKLKTILRFNPNNPAVCKDNLATKANICGRFLQMRFLNDTLYAIEANTGLFKIDVKAGTKLFVGPKTASKVSLYNSFAFDPKEPNMVYVTVSSRKWDILNIFWSFMDQESTGQVLALDISSGKYTVLFENLMTANGIEVDAKRDQLLISESIRSRVLSASLKDIRAAFRSAQNAATLKNVEMKALIPLVPGVPDNIVVEGDIAYVALPFVKLHGREMIDHLGTMPNVRKALGRFIYGCGMLLEYIYKNLYQHPLLETVYSELKCGHVNYRLVQTDKSAVIEYNLATGATRLFGSSTYGFVSEAMPDNKGNLYLGSFRSPFLVKQKM